MKSLSKIAATLSGFAVLAFIALGMAPAYADSPGQLEGGSFVYQVKNATTNGTYGNTISAKACDELQYRVWLHNTEFGALNNVTAKVNLPSASATSNTSTMTATTDLGGTSGTSGSATVNISSAQTVSYENGTAQLFSYSGGNSTLIKSLPDTITQSGGVNIGTLNGSTTEYITFRAKVSCPPAPVVKFACTQLDVTQIDRTRFDFTAHATVQNAVVQSYVFTTENSKNTNVDTTTVNTNALSAVYHFNQSTAGTYTVSAVVKTDKGNTEQTDACTKQVTVAAQPVVKGTETTKSLPNTGPGEVAGLFAGTSTIGAALHFATRRFRR